MFSVSIHFVTRPEKCTEFEQVIQSLKGRIAKESGCLGCTLYRNVEKPDEYMVLQEWETEILARQHLKSSSMAVLCGTRTLLTSQARISLTRDPSLMELEGQFIERIEKKKP